MNKFNPKFNNQQSGGKGFTRQEYGQHRQGIPDLNNFSNKSGLTINKSNKQHQDHSINSITKKRNIELHHARKI